MSRRSFAARSCAIAVKLYTRLAAVAIPLEYRMTSVAKVSRVENCILLIRWAVKWDLAVWLNDNLHSSPCFIQIGAEIKAALKIQASFRNMPARYYPVPWSKFQIGAPAHYDLNRRHM